MYFEKVFFNEKYEPQSIQLICEKCGEYIEVPYSREYINKVQPEYCIVINGQIIVCKCGNKCQNGLIEPKKMQKVIHIHKQSNPILSKPQCPTCQSTNLKKISATSKLVNTAVWGILGTKRHKTFHCNNCGYEW